MSSIKLRVEVLGGTRIKTAIAEAIQIARKLNVWVCFKFNGVDVMVDGDAEIEAVADTYDQDVSDYGCRLMMEPQRQESDYE